MKGDQHGKKRRVFGLSCHYVGLERRKAKKQTQRASFDIGGATP